MLPFQLQPHGSFAVFRILWRYQPSAADLVMYGYHSEIQHVHGGTVGELVMQDRVGVLAEDFHCLVKGNFDIVHYLFKEGMRIPHTFDFTQVVIIYHEDIRDYVTCAVDVGKTVFEVVPQGCFRGAEGGTVSAVSNDVAQEQHVGREHCSVPIPEAVFFNFIEPEYTLRGRGAIMADFAGFRKLGLFQAHDSPFFAVCSFFRKVYGV